MNLIKEKTVISRKNVIVMGLAVALFLFVVAVTLLGWAKSGRVNLPQLGFEVIILFVLLERSQARYLYEADNRNIRFFKDGLLGKKTYEVSYRQVIGIYVYKAKLIGVLKFRRTFRLNSALDGRGVWVLAYKTDNRGREVNERIYFKPSTDMLKFLAERMPGKVMIPENQVVVEALKNE